MILVLDASVVLKWFFQMHDDENHVSHALEILAGIDAGHIQMVQPPHFLAEVAAVLAREKPSGAKTDLIDLQNMEWQMVDNPSVYRMATDISVQLQHHLFDTLYHATALLVPEARFVTADERYYEQARETGNVTLLADFRIE